MKRLILMRHAKTEPYGEGIDDFGRALTEQGHADARRIAEELVAMDWSPQHILVSTARRARETCSEAAKVFEGEKVRPMEALYLCGVRGLSDVVKQNDREGTLMVIGHNPGIHDFALDILREGGSLDHYASLRLSEKFPTSCVALFEREEDGSFVPAAFRLTALLRAKDFREVEID
ncbi:MAG TPA: histidine phosphatase family protein [Hyphomonas sp.]|nr:histidine phosphatase family protein [Hyphomonas sp.]MCA8903872.1 histidine phosphatase family protein [Hyphomonas sp.]MCB9963002.1 histidine phosphatase family protein [Hyphomonas sp.]MCB9972351.1 histidine phosphatase family protein [Hyphomonas sp.]HPE49004.1 histidine phosphatase family protein [Hyphomonas sp.]